MQILIIHNRAGNIKDIPCLPVNPEDDSFDFQLWIWGKTKGDYVWFYNDIEDYDPEDSEGPENKVFQSLKGKVSFYFEADDFDHNRVISGISLPQYNHGQIVWANTSCWEELEKIGGHERSIYVRFSMNEREVSVSDLNNARIFVDICSKFFMDMNEDEKSVYGLPE